MASQQNVIVWDKEKGTEHFIRRASFNAAGNKVGFIAPTPTLPQLGEIDPKIFETARQIVQDRETLLLKSADAQSNFTKSMAAAAGVSVEQIVRVAGYNAITIRTDDSQEVQHWIRSNKFESFEGDKDWFDYYLKKKWYLTFFIVEKGAAAQLATETVRMSFKTETPFNPYYVPKGNLDKNAHLSLYFISQEAYKPDMTLSPASQRTQQFRLSQKSYESIRADLKGVDVNLNEPVMYSLDDSLFAQTVAKDLYFEPDPGARVYGEFEIPNQAGMGGKAAVFVCFMGAFAAIITALKAKRAKMVG